MVQYSVDLNGKTRKYPHYWEFCVGSCHAATLLREDVRNHIRDAHKDIGFKYIRFHGLFNDDMSVVIEDMYTSQITYSFENIDNIFDFLLDIGMKPFVEIGFMPEAFSSSSQTCFHYKGNVSMPKDDDQWTHFIQLFIRHLLERYGAEEVHQWYFEVWNEPNLRFFFDGTQEDYFKLYDMTARAIKEVDSALPVGGPATSANSWITPFIKYCESNQVPLDFITTHHYPSDDPLSNAGMNGPGEKGVGFDKAAIEQLPPEVVQEMMAAYLNKINENPREIMRDMTAKAKEEAGDYPLYYTEWNGSLEYDTPYQAAFIAHTLSYNEGMVEGYSYWTVSDVFEENGLKPGVFKNEFGIQTMQGIKKPSYRVFEALHQAGSQRLEVIGAHRTAELIALKNEESKEVTILAYNHDLERREIREEIMEIAISGTFDSVKVAYIDDNHANPLSSWKEMGSPVYISREQVTELKKTSEMKYEDLQVTEGKITLKLLPESVAVIKIN